MKKFKKVLEVFNIVYDVVVTLLKLALIIVGCFCLNKCYTYVPQKIEKFFSKKDIIITEAKSIAVKDGVFAKKVEYPVIHSTEKPYSCDFEVLEKYPELSGDELQAKIDEECQNTFELVDGDNV